MTSLYMSDENLVYFCFNGNKVDKIMSHRCDGGNLVMLWYEVLL